MELLSLCPLPVAPLVWQIQPSRWVLTIVAKATCRLEAGVAALASEQEPILDEDSHWDDDPSRSVIAPADLVPFKPRAEVVLVGSAHAPGGQPVRSLVARMNVGKIDKSIEVLCPRIRTRDGDLREGKRWTRTPLLYERAAGGPDTDNPVGVGPTGPRDPYGQLPLPNLQPPGFAIEGDRLPPTVGFGPVAASWPGRRSKLGRAVTASRGRGTSEVTPVENDSLDIDAPGPRVDRDWARAPFGEGFDPAYFQVAPPDQQVDALRVDERITLENLHPRHPLLVTSLPGLKVRARIELAGTPVREISLSPDTLWIDTDRGICTVTYRGKVDLEQPEQQGRVLVAMTKGDQPVVWSKIAPAPPGRPSVSPPPPSVRRSSPPMPAGPPGAPAAGGVPSVVVPSVVVPSPGAPSPALPGTVVSSVGAPSPALPSVVVPSPGAPARVPPAPAGRLPAPRSKALPTRIEVPPEPIEDEPSDQELDVEITMSESSTTGSFDRTGPIRPITRSSSPVAGDGGALPFQPAPPGWQSPAATPSRPGFGGPPTGGMDWAPTPAFGVPGVVAPPPVSSGAVGGAPVFGLPPPLPEWREAGGGAAPDSGAGETRPNSVPPPPPMVSAALPGLVARLGSNMPVASNMPTLPSMSGASTRGPSSGWGAVSPPAPISPPPLAPPPLAAPPLAPSRVPSTFPSAPPPEGAFGLLEASNAAAAGSEGRGESRGQSGEAAAGRVEVEARLLVVPGDAVSVELVWFDPAVGPLLSRSGAFARFRRPADVDKPYPEKGPGDKAGPDKGGSDKPAADAAPGGQGASPDPAVLELLVRAQVHDVLSRGTPVGPAGLDAALEAAEEETPPPPALVLVTGALELCLDEIEMLKAVVAAATPLATSDKKLKETLDVATEALKSPMLGMPDFAQGLGARIRDAWTRANRLLPPDHLSACTERLLLEQRSYQKRELLDDTWIRALLSGPGAETPVPTYLPARIARRLPLYRRFPVRLVGEVVWQQDQYETCPLAVRVLALGRLPPRARPRGRAGSR